jgi:hypothetical protein
MSDTGPLWLIINSASGSCTKETVDSLRAAIAPGASGPERIIDACEEDLPGRAALDTANVSCIAVLGGDGTLSDYLGRLEREGWQGAALPLPGGTQNLLCRAMFGARDATEIAAMLARGELSETRRTCLRCEAHTALAEILCGPGARWASVLENFREGEVGEGIGTSVEIARRAATGPLVAMAEPETGRADGYPGLHFAVADSAMEARGYHMDTTGEWLRQGAAIALRDFREGPREDLGMLSRARCRSTGGEPIDLMVDGEHAVAGSEITIETDTFNLTLMGLSA